MAQIMVVDDSATVRNEVSSFFKQNGFEVETAVDGQDGLRKIGQDRNLKLVVSDINMPNMDGLTMVEKVRRELNRNDLHVIMLTTESDPRMKERGKSAQVKGWIVKPFNGNAVLPGVKKLLGV